MKLLDKDHDWVKSQPNAWALYNITEIMRSDLPDEDKATMVKDTLSHISYAYFD